MKNVTLNIGLENNPYYASQIIDLLKGIFGREIKTRTHVGQWEGKPERTLIVNFNSSYKLVTFTAILKDLCKLFTQDAIALEIIDGQNYHGALIYGEDFKGEKYNFDPSYFINFDVIKHI